MVVVVLMTKNPDRFKRWSFKLFRGSTATNHNHIFICLHRKLKIGYISLWVAKLWTDLALRLKKKKKNQTSKSFSLSAFEWRNPRSERTLTLKVHSKKLQYSLSISFATNKFRFTVKQIFLKGQHPIKGGLRSFHHYIKTAQQQHFKLLLTFNKSITYGEHLLPSVLRIQILWKKREEGDRRRQRKWQVTLVCPYN